MKGRKWALSPNNWVSLKPFGYDQPHPNNYLELWKALVENGDELSYAWKILRQGVCDGCALGTTGMRDWTLPGVHLCNIRLRLLRLNTMGPLDTSRLGNVDALRGLKGDELRNLGRLPYPMMRQKGEAGFARVTWNEALDAVAERIRDTLPERVAFYLTSRGMPNESYYVAQKAARAMGTNNIDNAARICHSPSTTALKNGVGVAASTCSYSDWIESDLLVFIGSNVANNQPVATKYIHYAKKNGAKVAVINNYREPGMERYWIPSVPESALFGTKIADRFFLINAGSDIAFINGVLKHIIENDWYDEAFVGEHTTGFEELTASLAGQSWEDLEGICGASRHDMYDFARMVNEAEKAVFVWSMGITQHAHGVENVEAIVNVALTKGFVGREGCGLMPIRGHSGVQGGAEMGAYSTALPGGLPITEENAASLSKAWGFKVPTEKGLTAPEMIDAAFEGKLDVLFSAGGNFIEVLPDPSYVEEALGKIPMRVHMDLVLSKQMFVDPADTVVLLPAATRYETQGGVTQTSTERRIAFSPEIPGRRIGEALPEWEAFEDLARRVRRDIAHLLAFKDTHAIREEIARVVPFYAGIERMQRAGDEIQYGGLHLCAQWKFGTANGKAHFAALTPPANDVPEGMFLVTTRRGKQFNTMIHEAKDSLTGAVREAVFIHPDDARALGLEDGDNVRLENGQGAYEGVVLCAPVKPGNLQIHWPEGNVLIDRKKRAASGVPDYNAAVTLKKMD